MEDRCLHNAKRRHNTKPYSVARITVDIMPNFYYFLEMANSSWNGTG